MKSFFNFVLTILLIYFSFYYTNLVSNYLKSKDPIMIKLKSVENEYQEDYVNAIIVNNTIIPGLNGKIIDLNKSYLKMKKLNSYNDSLLVFKEIKPSISIYDNYDKFIINGNNKLKQVSILLKINDLNILKQIDNKNINFILSSNFINNNLSYLNNIKNSIVVSQNDLENNLFDYCYTLNTNEKNNCKDINKFTIIPNFITYNYYYNTYKILQNGSILAYNVLNYQDINEINILINGIKNLGYDIVSLDKLIRE